MFLTLNLIMTILVGVHRLGRSGRAGNHGKCVAFFDSDHDEKMLDKLKEWIPLAQQPAFVKKYEGDVKRVKSKLNDFVRPED